MADNLKESSRKRSVKSQGLTPAQQKRLNANTTKKTGIISPPAVVAEFVESIPAEVPPTVPQITATNTPPGGTYSLIRPERLSFSGFVKPGMFDVNTELPLLPEAEYKTKLELLKSEQRWSSVATERQIANLGWVKAQGAEILTQTEVTKNEIKVQNWNTEGVKLQQAHTRTDIEQAKLQMLGHDLAGTQQEAVFKGQAWQAKLMSVRADVTYALAIAQQKEQELAQLAPFKNAS